MGSGIPCLGKGRGSSQTLGGPTGLTKKSINDGVQFGIGNWFGKVNFFMVSLGWFSSYIGDDFLVVVKVIVLLFLGGLLIMDKGW